MLFMTVPRHFTIWWLFWSEHKPDDFVLPPILAQFPNYSIRDEDDDLTPLLVDDDDEETELDRVVARAWHSIPSVDQNLMIYCWAARQAEKVICHRIVTVDQTVSVAEAKVFLMEDINKLQGLHDRAICNC
jgi:hypothetical protein